MDTENPITKQPKAASQDTTTLPQPIAQQKPPPSTSPPFFSTANGPQSQFFQQPPPSSAQPPPPGGRGLSNLIPGLGGGNPLANLAKNVVVRYTTAYIILFAVIMGFTAFMIGDATTGEASPVETTITPSPSGTGALTPVSPTTTAQVVPVGQGGAKIASAARQIAQQLVKPSSATASYCAAGDSFHCWDNSNQFKMTKFNQEADATYVQCTEFIWAVLGDDTVGYQKEIASIKNHDAYLWVDMARANPEALQYFHIIPPEEASQLQPGDIISSGGGIGPYGYRWGHVAIVTAREENRVEVAQAGTAKNTEDWFITNGRLVSPFKSTAREPIQGFFRIKTP